MATQPDSPVKNQYRGINAHLHSFWQATRTWGRFHNAHITHLMEKLQDHLPPGYEAEMEESLQIRRLDEGNTRHPKADVMVYDTDPYRAPTSPGTSPAAELTVADLVQTEDTEHPYSAVAIRPLSADMETGEAVAWIELFSPTNKGDTQDAYDYVAKRRMLLDAGIVFVELDYLHESPPTFPTLADYTRLNLFPDAPPYRILVLDPRPDFRTGPAKIYDFRVDDPFPTVTIPLNAGDKVAFDFSVPYQHVFEAAKYGRRINYSQFPLNFERYSPSDQARIARRMLAIAKAKQAGLDLETALLPVEDHLTLEEARAQLEAMKP